VEFLYSIWARFVERFSAPIDLFVLWCRPPRWLPHTFSFGWHDPLVLLLLKVLSTALAAPSPRPLFHRPSVVLFFHVCLLLLNGGVSLGYLSPFPGTARGLFSTLAFQRISLSNSTLIHPPLFPVRWCAYSSVVRRFPAGVGSTWLRLPSLFFFFFFFCSPFSRLGTPTLTTCKTPVERFQHSVSQFTFQDWRGCCFLGLYLTILVFFFFLESVSSLSPPPKKTQP